MNWEDKSLKTEQIYQNIMELLVREEIERQLKVYPQQIKSSFNEIEIEAYALNRLPALYASSEKGRDIQKQIGQEKYGKDISLAVRRALAMVEQNPQRHLRALAGLSDIETKYHEAQKALKKLHKFLIQAQLIKHSEPAITSDNLLRVVQQALKRLYWKENQKDVQLKIQSQAIDDDLSLGWDSDLRI